MSTARTWRYPLAARIAVSVAGAFMFLFAGVLFAVPYIASPANAPADATASAVAFGTGAILAGFAAFVTLASISIGRTRITIGADGLDASVSDHQIFLL